MTNKDYIIAKADMQQQLQAQILRVVHAIKIIAAASIWKFITPQHSHKWWVHQRVYVRIFFR